jgi:lysophospholipase L1-like esterase
VSRLLLALLGLLLGLGLSEGLARLTLCQDSLLFSGPNRLYGWGHTPNASGWAQRCVAGKPEWRAYTSINSLGLRDREIPYAPRPPFRILVLGDSFTAGLQVAQDRTFVKLLESALDAGAPPASRVEVLNAGVSGWGTDNELLYYRAEGWKYRADLVLLVFNTGNDVMEDSPALLAVSPFPYPDKPHFVLEDGRLRLRHFPLPAESPVMAALRAARRALDRHSVLYRLVNSLGLRVLPAAANAAAPPAGPNPGEVYLRQYPPRWQEAWRLVRGLVLTLKRDVEAHGSRFAVVVMNAKEEVMTQRILPWRDFDKPNRLITEFLARRHISAIPLLETFRANYRTTGETGYFTWDVHWTERGHAIAAAEIARGLEAQGLVPAARGSGS